MGRPPRSASMLPRAPEASRLRAKHGAPRFLLRFRGRSHLPELLLGRLSVARAGAWRVQPAPQPPVRGEPEPSALESPPALQPEREQWPPEVRFVPA